MPKADRLEMDRRHDLPARRRSNLPGEMGGVRKVASQARLEPGDALFADQEPQFQRPKAPAEGDAGIAQITNPAVDRGLQEARIGRHDPQEMLLVTNIVE